MSSSVQNNFFTPEYQDYIEKYPIAGSVYTKYLQSAGDLLQYIIPVAAGVAFDLAEPFAIGNYPEVVKRTVLVAALYLFQNQTTKFLKHLHPKERPNGSGDGQAGPSGHFTSAVMAFMRTCGATNHVGIRMLAAAGATLVAASRYMPGMHDLKDLTTGGALGIALGSLWNIFNSRLY